MVISLISNYPSRKAKIDSLLCLSNYIFDLAILSTRVVLYCFAYFGNWHEQSEQLVVYLSFKLSTAIWLLLVKLKLNYLKKTKTNQDI